MMNNLINKFRGLTKVQQWLAIGVIVVIFGAVTIKLTQPKELSGSYTATIGAGFFSSKDTMKFDGDTVTELRKSGKNIKSTYSIDGDDITFKFSDGTKAHAKLSDDGKSFKITSAEGLAALGEGLKYTKDE